MTVYALALETRMRAAVSNSHDRTPPIAGAQQHTDKLIAQYKSARPRTILACNTYNCHGLTFAARRTCIAAADVPAILKDDEYVRVADGQEVLPGDVALYSDSSSFAHSGIVVGVRSGVPWIVSKWGFAHEAIHSVLDCPYSECTVSYYRVLK